MGAQRPVVQPWEETLVVTAVTIWVQFLVVALTLAWLTGLYDTPEMRGTMVLLCLPYVVTGAGAVIALVARTLCFLIESVG